MDARLFDAKHQLIGEHVMNHRSQVSPLEKWPAVYAEAVAAGKCAAAACIPRPMKVSDYLCLEGECGGAYLVLEGRGSFARWLIVNGHATVNRSIGIRVWADIESQSMDRAMAYISAFHAVIESHGVRVRASKSYLD